MTLEKIKEVAKTVEENLNRYVTHDIHKIINCDIFKMTNCRYETVSEIESVIKGNVAILVALGYGKYNLDKSIIFLTDTALGKVYNVLEDKTIEPTLTYIIDELKCKVILVYSQLTERVRKELGSNFGKKDIEVRPSLIKEEVQLEDQDNTPPWEWLR